MRIRITPPSAPHVRLARRTPVRTQTVRTRPLARFPLSSDALFTNEYMGVTKALPWGHFSREVETPPQSLHGIGDNAFQSCPPFVRHFCCAIWGQGPISANLTNEF